MRLRRLFFLILFACAAQHVRADSAHPGLDWRDWQPETLAAARAEQKFILLDLEAVWCHWCHVMARTTYRDPAVVARLKKHFISIRVDQDARPDLAERYREYGWPATVFFAPAGQEIAIRSGYIAPENLARLLDAIVADPSPEHLAETPPPAPAPVLAPTVMRELERRFIATHDAELGGLKLAQKFLDRDTVEWALTQALRGDANARAMARRDLDAALALIDPAWGGVNQYSTHGDWQHVHFEKLAQNQAEYLRVYALAAQVLDEPRYLFTARRIAAYIQRFLRAPDGGYHTSQDADLIPGDKATSQAYFKLDDAARSARGIPRIDTQRYAREAGLMAAAYAQLHVSGGAASDLAEARRALDWALAHRSLPGAGFGHAEKDSAGPYLADTLAMLRGLLAVYGASGERRWLDHARAATIFIERHFRSANGYASAVSTTLAPRPTLDENLALARAALQLAHYTGEAEPRAMAGHAMRYLAHPDVALSRATEAGLLLLADSLQRDPLHLTVVGHKSDPRAQVLWRAALGVAAVTARREWWDAREGPLPNPDVSYPEFDRPAAYLCSEKRCSQPAFTPGELTERTRARPASALPRIVE